jgi:hypothetical protein
MSEADLLQPEQVIKERWKVVSEKIILNYTLETKSILNLCKSFKINLIYYLSGQKSEAVALAKYTKQSTWSPKSMWR